MKEINAIELVKKSETALEERFKEFEETALYNQKKVLNAFKKNAVQARHFSGTTGYGYDDAGRDVLNSLFADVLGAEAAIVSPNIVSGTHALTLMLFGVLRPGDTLLSISGMPYDTLTDVISGVDKGSLADFSIKFECVDLLRKGLEIEFDRVNISKILKNRRIKAVFIGRSRGYSWRSALSVGQIGEIIDYIRGISPETLILVDNCYGEFVEKIEPTDVGADLAGGSLIKNMGGGLAPTGGYVAGKRKLVEQVSYRLTAPSVGCEEGSFISGYLSYYQGLFFAPSVVKNALKSSYLFAKSYEFLGYEALPSANMPAHDIVTSIKLGTENQLIDFCRAIQSVSPVDSNVAPEAWDMPGYKDKVIMAAGTFIQGASIELSADAPIREPYIVYLQGGLTYEHAKLALIETLQHY